MTQKEKELDEAKKKYYTIFAEAKAEAERIKKETHALYENPGTYKKSLADREKEIKKLEDEPIVGKHYETGHLRYANIYFTSKL